jgi:hypothetical protein
MAVARADGDMLSAVYEGTLRHRRWGPGVANEFSYRVAMPLIDLDEVDALTSLHPLWSSRFPAPVWFRRADFLGDPARPLAEAVRDLVSQRSGLRPTGKVALLANLRTWGWLFNPISLYFCYSADGSAVERLVAEVENTPWHERCQYVVGPPGSHRFAKSMHVSPFLPMEVDYRLRYRAPGERLVVQLDVMADERRLFGATLSLRRRPLNRHELGRLVWDYPAMSHRVSAGIYWQAARLGLRRAPFFAHPRRRALGMAPFEPGGEPSCPRQSCPRQSCPRPQP